MINEDAEKHKTKIIRSDVLVSINGFGISFVKYSLYLAIDINIAIRIERIIKVLDIESIDDISVILFSVVYGDIRSIFIIISVIAGIKICQ